MSKKILIVDDSATMRQQVNFTLSKSGFTVVEANDGQEGIAKIKEHQDLALIISDVNMPVMNGIEMLEEIKKQQLSSKVPCIMLTTEGKAELIERAKLAGVKGWIVKPFKPEQLVAIVTKIAI